MAEITIDAKKREIKGKASLKKLRNDSFIPGVYYTKGIDAVPIVLDDKSVNKLVYTSETHLINLAIDKDEPVKCVVKNVQFDPLSDEVIHIDFYGVTIGQALELQVPITFVGQPKGIKEGGIVQEFLHKLDIECLPRHIPENLEIDITELHLGDSISIGDLSFENVTILNPEDVVVVSISHPRAIETEEEAEEEELLEGEEEEEERTEPEVIGKGKTEEE